MSSAFVIRNAVRFGRRLLAGRTQFAFERPQSIGLEIDGPVGLYVHVPFCAQLCPYCPYDRIPYDRALADAFVESVGAEARQWAQRLPGRQVSSIYFGGGTPTILGPQLAQIAASLREAFAVSGPLCLETNPADLTPKKVRMLADLGVESISLGVQSFQQPLLQRLGRKYSPAQARRALEWLARERWAINVDLMFALPGQSMEDLDADLREALSCGAQQLTAYPLFTFPYSAVASHRALQGVQMPRLPTRRRMFRRVWDRSTAAGFAPVSVWSFMRPEGGHRYSSVTRRRFLGLGPSAASFDGRRYLLNTFSVPEYVRSVRERGHAVALSMPIEPRLERLYDFYWRLYDTYVPKTKPGASAVPGRRRIEALLDAGGLLGMLEQDASGYRLNRRGAFWIHVAQNYFFLSDVNTIWATALRDPWPARIAF